MRFFLLGLALTLAITARAEERGIKRASSGPKKLRAALVIGNANYKVSPLKNPVNDAELMSRKLRAAGFTVSTLTNASQRRMNEAIRAFGRELRDTQSVGLFYYAGHGVQWAGKNYLVPVDAPIDTLEDVEAYGVPLAAILGKMRSAANPLNIVILDACRNNPFVAGSRSTTRGLASVTAPSGTFIAYATSPGAVAFDGREENGVYTAALAEQLDADGLPIEEVFKRTRVSVMQKTEDRQVPWESSSLRGAFYFRGGTPVSRAAASVPAKAGAWEAVAGLGIASLLREYAVKTPEGTRGRDLAVRLGFMELPVDARPSAFFVVQHRRVERRLPSTSDRGLRKMERAWRRAADRHRALMKERWTAVDAVNDSYADKFRAAERLGSSTTALERQRDAERAEIQARYAAMEEKSRALVEHTRRRLFAKLKKSRGADELLLRANIEMELALERHDAELLAWDANEGKGQEPVLRLERAKALFERVALEFPRSRAAGDALYDLGYAISQSDPREATKAFRLLVDDHVDHPARAEALLRIGMLHFDDRNFSEAVPALQRCSADASADAGRFRDHCLYLLAWAQFLDASYDAATGTFVKVINQNTDALREDAEETLPRSLLSSAKLVSGRWDFAERYQKLAPRIDEPASRVRVGQQLARQLFDAGIYGAARRVALEAISQQPRVSATMTLALIALRSSVELADRSAVETDAEFFRQHHMAHGDWWRANESKAGVLRELNQHRKDARALAQLSALGHRPRRFAERAERAAWLVERCLVAQRAPRTTRASCDLELKTDGRGRATIAALKRCGPMAKCLEQVLTVADYPASQTAKVSFTLDDGRVTAVGRTAR